MYMHTTHVFMLIECDVIFKIWASHNAVAND